MDYVKTCEGKGSMMIYEGMNGKTRRLSWCMLGKHSSCLTSSIIKQAVQAGEVSTLHIPKAGIHKICPLADGDHQVVCTWHKEGVKVASDTWHAKKEGPVTDRSLGRE